jgi:hypothetical protein
MHVPQFHSAYISYHTDMAFSTFGLKQFSFQTAAQLSFEQMQHSVVS